MIYSLCCLICPTVFHRIGFLVSGVIGRYEVFLSMASPVSRSWKTTQISIQGSQLIGDTKFKPNSSFFQAIISKIQAILNESQSTNWLDTIPQNVHKNLHLLQENFQIEIFLTKNHLLILGSKRPFQRWVICLYPHKISIKFQFFLCFSSRST